MDATFNEEPDDIDNDIDAIDHDAVYRVFEQFENQVQVGFVESGDTQARADDASPLHGVHFEIDLLFGSIDVLDLLQDREGDLEQIGRNKQVVCDADEEEHQHVDHTVHRIELHPTDPENGHVESTLICPVVDDQ